MKKLALIFLTLFMSSQSYSAPHKAPVFVIHGAIGDNTRPVIAQLINSRSHEIVISINSPGGSGEVALEFVEAIQRLSDNGVSITCKTQQGVASAAFIMYAACPKRKATGTSKMLWHRGYIYIQGYVQGLAITQKDMSDMFEAQKKYDALVRTGFHVSDDVFYYLRDKEVLFSAEQANSYSPGFVEIERINPLTQSPFEVL